MGKQIACFHAVQLYASWTQVPNPTKVHLLEMMIIASITAQAEATLYFFANKTKPIQNVTSTDTLSILGVGHSDSEPL